jgi:hypothetical protein
MQQMQMIQNQKKTPTKSQN